MKTAAPGAVLLCVALLVCLGNTIDAIELKGEETSLHNIAKMWSHFQLQREARGEQPYSPDEIGRRLENFVHNIRRIHEHNGRKEPDFQLGITRFADMSEEEWKEFVSGQHDKLEIPAVRSKPGPAKKAPTGLCPPDKKLPSSWRWQDVTAPGEQGQFGGPGLIATIESIVDGYTIKYGQRTQPSRQELIDCAGENDFPSQFYEWIIQHGGIDTESSYPYNNYPGTCSPTNQYAAQLAGYLTPLSGNETDLACAVAFYQPSTVCVDASHASFQLYGGGIYYEPACATNNPDHCMMVVGYGSLGPGKDYWIVENSWGIDWGLNGYIWMARNRGNNCGIASYAALPVIK